MDTTIPPEAAEYLIAAAGMLRPHLEHLPPKEAQRRFAEMAKLYYPESTTNLRVV